MNGLEATGVADPERVPKLTRLLRSIGAVALIASASSFLVHNWEGGSDIQRYLSLLAHTVMLAVAGFFCGMRIRDSKSARTFLAVAAGLIPAHFCILGGLLYSQLSLDGGAGPVARYATWVAPSAPAALLTLAGALLVLAPVAWVSFLALARSHARPISLGYLALNLPMLVPTRDPEVVAILVAFSFAVLAWLELRMFRGGAALRTLEGAFVRAMLVAPTALMLARSFLHYELSWLLHAVLLGSASALIFAAGRELRRKPDLGGFLQGFATLPAGAAWFSFAAALERAGLPDGAVLPAFVLPFAASLLGMSLLANGSGAAYRRLAALVAVAGMCLDLALLPSVAVSLCCLVVSIATLAYGYLLERRLLFLIGGAGLLFALVHHVQYAIELYAWSHWGSLAALGAAVILAASLIERHHERLFAHAAGLRKRVAAWDY